MIRVEIEDYTQNALEKISKATGICYQKEVINHHRVTRALSKGHDSILRFAYATFKISGISRNCSHQIVRIAHAGILQESQRYVEGPFLYVTPESFKKNDKVLSLYESLCIESDYFYKYAREQGIKKEDARYGLLTSSETTLTITGNFQMWKHFLELRLSKQTQWEIRAVAYFIHGYLTDICPEVFGRIYEQR